MALVTAVAQVPFLAQEFPYALGMVNNFFRNIKKKKKKKRKEEKGKKKKKKEWIQMTLIPK